MRDWYTLSSSTQSYRPNVDSSAFVFACLILLLGSTGCSGNIDKLNRSLEDLRSIQAQQTAQLDEMQTELSQLKGTIEELDDGVGGKTRELEQKLQRFGTRVPPPPGVPANLLVADEEQIAKMRGPAAEMFSGGLARIRGGEYQRAEALFQQFASDNPDTTFSDNALFWVGVCREKQGLYDRAVAAYGEVYQRYPAEDRVPPALFRLAESFSKMQSYDQAEMTLKKLVDEHPRSPYTKKARTRLGEIRALKNRARG